MRPRRCAGVVLAVFAVGMAVSACSSSAAGSHDGGSSVALLSGGVGTTSTPTGAPGTAQSHPSSAAASPGGATPATPQGTGGTPPGSTPLQYAPGTTPAAVDARLASSCVRPGGTQRLFVTAHPGLEVAYNTQYADNSDGSKNGGSGKAPVPASGTFEADWVVSVTAPLGTATCYVSVAGGNESAFRQPSFNVSGSC